MSAALYLGCAGWSLPVKHQEKFPRDGTHLERYAQVFSAVEINSSFYRPHRPETYARWRDCVPAHFRFSVKVPREITHMRRLRDCAELLQIFLNEAGRLEEKLGCLLVQLPPSLRYDPTTAETFFRDLRRLTGVPIACEPRHSGWFSAEATALLSACGISRVIADPMPVPTPGMEPKASFGYFRLHGSPEIYRSSYTDDYLARLATRLSAMRQDKQAVWCVFDNTAEGAALENALSLKARV